MNVLTLGTFDLFHRGHVALLKRCAQIAGKGEVVVAVNGDAFVTAYKGKPPVIAYRDRAEVVRACRHVSWVTPNPQQKLGDSIVPFLESLRTIGMIVVGSDWRDRDYFAQIGVTQAALDRLGILVVFVPYTPGISTTMLREALA